MELKRRDLHLTLDSMVDGELECGLGLGMVGWRAGSRKQGAGSISPHLNVSPTKKPGPSLFAKKRDKNEKKRIAQ